MSHPSECLASADNLYQFLARPPHSRWTHEQQETVRAAPDFQGFVSLCCGTHLPADAADDPFAVPRDNPPPKPHSLNCLACDTTSEVCVTPQFALCKGCMERFLLDADGAYSLYVLPGRFAGFDAWRGRNWHQVHFVQPQVGEPATQLTLTRNGNRTSLTAYVDGGAWSLVATDSSYLAFYHAPSGTAKRRLEEAVLILADTLQHFLA